MGGSEGESERGQWEEDGRQGWGRERDGGRRHPSKPQFNFGNVPLPFLSYRRYFFWILPTVEELSEIGFTFH